MPIESGGSTISIDRGSHYWNHMKLMNSHVSIAEQEGEIVATNATAFIPLMVGGEERTPYFAHFGEREHPDRFIVNTQIGDRERGERRWLWF